MLKKYKMRNNNNKNNKINMKIPDFIKISLIKKLV